MMACIQAKNFIRISAINTCIRVKFFKRGTIFTNSQQNIKAISAQTRTPISFNAIHSRKHTFELSICKRTYQKRSKISKTFLYSLCLFNCTREKGMNNFGYLNSALYFTSILQQTCEKKFMTYVRLQLNLPNSPNTSQYVFCWTATPPLSVRTIRMTPPRKKPYNPS